MTTKGGHESQRVTFTERKVLVQVSENQAGIKRSIERLFCTDAVVACSMSSESLKSLSPPIQAAVKRPETLEVPRREIKTHTRTGYASYYPTSRFMTSLTSGGILALSGGKVFFFSFSKKNKTKKQNTCMCLFVSHL